MTAGVLFRLLLVPFAVALLILNARTGHALGVVGSAVAIPALLLGAATAWRRPGRSS